MFVRQTTVSRRLSDVAASECWVKTIIIIICNFCVRPANAAAAPALPAKPIQFFSMHCGWLCHFEMETWTIAQCNNSGEHRFGRQFCINGNWRNFFQLFSSAKSFNYVLFVLLCAAYFAQCSERILWIPLNATEDEHKVSKRRTDILNYMLRPFGCVHAFLHKQVFLHFE